MQTGKGLPVLMLHGNPTWSFLWRKVATALAGQPLQIVMPDLVGLGLSDKPRDLAFHQLDTHAHLVGSFIDALGLKSVILVGQDWGGPIGLLALAERQGCTAGLVLMNTLAESLRVGGRTPFFHRFSRWPVISDVAFRLLGFPLNALATVQGDPNSISGEVAAAYRWPLARAADRVAPLALARMVPSSADHPSAPGLRRCHAFLNAFSGPTALVWGKRDPILGHSLHRMERVLPRARVTQTRAGHFLQEEVPLEIAAAIRDVAQRAHAARRPQDTTPT